MWWFVGVDNKKKQGQLRKWNIYIFKIIVLSLTFGGDQLFWQRGNTSSFCAQWCG